MSLVFKYPIIKHYDDGDKWIKYLNDKGINLINDSSFVLNTNDGNIKVNE